MGRSGCSQFSFAEYAALCYCLHGVACYWITGAMSTDPSMLSWLELGPDDLALGMKMLGQQGGIAAPGVILRKTSCAGSVNKPE